MTIEQYSHFDTFRKELKNYCQEFSEKFSSELIPLQKNASKKDTPDYPIENPVVYNTALDEITRETEIKKIIIGDNPGKNEQLSCNKKYLVGQAGKIAAGFFQKNKEFNTDFRKNAIILNKTPVHSAKTNHLKEIIKNSSPELKAGIYESMEWMAEKTASLHKNLCLNSCNKNDEPELWLVGYSELKQKGIFELYRDTLLKNYTTQDSIQYWNKVFVFQHFSMNRFSVDLKNFQEETKIFQKNIAAQKLGILHRKEIFGI